VVGNGDGDRNGIGIGMNVLGGQGSDGRHSVAFAFGMNSFYRFLSASRKGRASNISDDVRFRVFSIASKTMYLVHAISIFASNLKPS
jgi:hypothetical protein